MKMFDPHVHMTSRTTEYYQAMAQAGIVAIIEPAFWLGQPRTHAGTFADYFASLVGWERFRARQFGIAHFCTIALNPKEANDERLAGEVLAMVPRWLEKYRRVPSGVNAGTVISDEDWQVIRRNGALVLAGVIR